MKKIKTNAMRMLERQRIDYELREFPLNGQKAAEYLGLPSTMIFKTLVTTDTAGKYFVFCVPTNEELDLKKAAKTVGVKRIEMLKQKELFSLTGYIHGGCSPVGMKKLFPTVIDSSVEKLDTILVSAGHVGMLMELLPKDLVQIINANIASVIK
ncbi:Cys-tRNA(Pro) deacylase [Faecalimonas sp.]